MKTLLSVVILIFTLADAAPVMAASFVGRWRAVAESRDGVRKSIPKAVKMIIVFSANGDFRQTVQMGKRPGKPEVGTWKLGGRGVIVKSGPSKRRQTVKRFAYRVSRGHLYLTMKLGKETVVIDLRRKR